MRHLAPPSVDTACTLLLSHSSLFFYQHRTMFSCSRRQKYLNAYSGTPNRRTFMRFKATFKNRLKENQSEDHGDLLRLKAILCDLGQLCFT